MKTASIEDYRTAAQRRLPRFLFEYLDGGSYRETTLARNITDLQRIAPRQRVLRNVSEIDLSVDLFGATWAMPLALGPVGLAGMNARRGEVQAARAAERAGVPFCLSTVSACPLAEVGRAVQNPIWLQLYMMRDRNFIVDMLAQARSFGVETLIFTVDMPVPGTRYRDYRSGLAGAPGWAGHVHRFTQAALRPAWAWDVGLWGRPHTLGNVAQLLGPHTGLNDFFAWMRNNFDPSVTWADIDWIRAQWPGRIVIKGLLDPDDSEEAVQRGADGIIVSNHGGRQLDGVRSTAAALPSIVERVDRRIPVLVDGGIRSGLDILRMIALGADGVLIGRAWAFALAGRGEKGVAHILKLFGEELRVAMALCGVRSIGEINRTVIE